MNKYELISNYKDNEIYLKSFNDLIEKTFGINFIEFKAKGAWDDNYINYSYLDNNKVIANVSINKMTIVHNNKQYPAIQIGTVATDPDYRNQGLSTKLINHVLDIYEDTYDYIYLFANESVLDFYPKFNFKRVNENTYTIINSISEYKKEPLKLDYTNSNDLELVKNFAANRLSISSYFGVVHNAHLLLFCFIVALSDAFYYLEDEDIIVVYEYEDTQLHVYDIIFTKTTSLNSIIKKITKPTTTKINLYFSIDENIEGLEIDTLTDTDDYLFIRSSKQCNIKHLLFPAASHG